MNFPAYKTSPFDHQGEEVEEHWEKPRRALWWEMGTGKSKVVLDVAARMFAAGMIDGLLILAPNGVHRNWVVEEFPAHFSEEIADVSETLFWEPQRAVAKKYDAKVERLMSGKFAMLTMTYSAIMTDKGRDMAKQFLTKRRCMYVLDESQYIKTPSAKRTIRVLSSAQYADIRWVLSGTPVDNSPFDVYTQMKFIKPNAWQRFGCSTFAAFKTYFGRWVEDTLYVKGKPRQIPNLVGFRNLDKMNQVMNLLGSRKLKSETLDLPPKLYVTRTFRMSPEQRRVYQEVKEEFVAWLESGEQVTAALAIVRLTRLQQIVCNYVGTDTGDLIPLGQPNLRLKCVQELLEEIPGKVLMFAKFTEDIDQICGLAKAKDWAFVRYDGQVSNDDRAAAIEEFQRGEARLFVANPSAAGTGLTLHAARYVVYYNNSFKLSTRLQSEDRAHRIGQHHPVTYYDLVAEDTIDLHLLRSLRKKKQVAELVMGDEFSGWLA